jgi:hypothetical protein
MEIDIDHVAMPVGDIERSVEFYVRVFGAKADGLEKWRAGKWPIVSISFGRNRFNLHPPDNKITLKATHPMIGGGDYCFVWPGTPDSAIQHLRRNTSRSRKVRCRAWADAARGSASTSAIPTGTCSNSSATRHRRS